MHGLEKSLMSTLFGIHIICETTVQDGWQYRIHSVVYSWRIMSPWSVVRLGGTEQGRRRAWSMGLVSQRPHRSLSATCDLSRSFFPSHFRLRIILVIHYASSTLYQHSLSLSLHRSRCAYFHQNAQFWVPASNFLFLLCVTFFYDLGIQ